jgi:hypothetical protein
MKFSFAEGKIVVDSYAELRKVLDCFRGERIDNQDYQGFGNSAWLFEEQTGGLESFFDYNKWHTSVYNEHMPQPADLKLMFRLLDLHKIPRDARLSDLYAFGDALFDLALIECYIEYVRVHREYPINSEEHILYGAWTEKWVNACRNGKYVKQLAAGAVYHNPINVMSASMTCADPDHIFALRDSIMELCERLEVKFGIFAYGAEVLIDADGDGYYNLHPDDEVSFENEYGAMMYDTIHFNEAEESEFFPARILINHSSPVLTQKDFSC